MYKAFNKFKLQVNNVLAEGHFLMLDQKQRVAMLLNWMGGKVYVVFANDLIFKDPEQGRDSMKLSKPLMFISNLPVV